MKSPRRPFELMLRSGFVVLALVAACGEPPPPKEPPLVADPPLDVEGASQAEEGAATSDLDRGIAYIKNEKFAEAKQHLEAAMARKPSPEAAYYLGLSLEKTGDRAGAEGMYKKALELNGGFSEASVNLAALYLDEPPRPDEAIAVLEKAIAASKDDVRLLQNLAYAYGLKGDVQKASKAYEAALAKGEDAQLRFAYGAMLFENKQPDKAAEQLKKALAGVQKDAPMLVTLGRMLGSSKAYAECVEAFNRAIALKKTEAEWFVRRGTCKHELKDEAGAQADYEEAIKVDPNFAAAHYYLGMSFLAQHKKLSASRALEKAAKLGGETPIAKAAKQKLKEIAKMK